VHYLGLFCALFALCTPRKNKITKKCKSGPESQNSSARKKMFFKKKFRKLVADFTTWRNLKKMVFVLGTPITGASHMGRGRISQTPRDFSTGKQASYGHGPQTKARKNRFKPIGDCHLCLDRQAAEGTGERHRRQPSPWPWPWRYEAFSCTRSLSYAVVSAVIRSRNALNARGDALLF
jgi:hypothetical protein